jgi:hypothetical protein
VIRIDTSDARVFQRSGPNRPPPVPPVPNPTESDW